MAKASWSYGISRALLERPVSCVLAHLLASAIFALALPRLELRTDGAALHPEDEPAVAATATDRRTFGETDQLILLLTSREQGPDVSSPAGFAALKELHGALAGLDGVEGDGVRSLVSLLEPPTHRRFLLNRTYLENVPVEPAGFAGLLERIRAHPLTDGLFLSPDGRAAALYVPLPARIDRQRFLGRAERWLSERRPAGFELSLTGPVVAEALLGRSVLRDLSLLVPLMVLGIAALLLVTLRTPAGVLVPLVEVLMVLVWTLGAMAWSGVPVTLVTTILPVVLMSMAVLDEIHLLERLQRRLAEVDADDGAAGSGRERLRRAVLAALGDVGRPIVLTSLTTAAAFLSFLTAAMAPVRHFGLFAAFGIVFAMALTFTFIPALAVLLPASWHRPLWGSAAGRNAGDRRLRLEGWLADGGSPRWKLAALALATALAVPGLWRLTVQDSWIDNFDPGSPLVASERAFNRHFWGTYRFDVVCRAESEGFFLTPEGAASMEEVREVARAGPHVGGVVTYLLPFELMARPQGYGDKLSGLTPLKIGHLARRLELVSSRIDLEQFLTADGRAARARILVKSPDYRRGLALAEHLESRLAPLGTARPVACHWSGDLPVAMAVVGSIVGNQLRSIVWTLAALGVLLWLVTRSLRRSAALLLPVVLAAGWVFAVMGWLGLPLGIASSMFAALSLGVGVDFGLHFAHAYDRERPAGHRRALAGALDTAGRALRWNALVLALGFLVLTASALRPNHGLGLLLTLAIVSAWLATLAVLPVLLERTSGR